MAHMTPRGDALRMVTVRTWLTHDRQDPPVDPVFDAACDLIIATRTFETASMRRPDDPPSIAATLGVLDASVRTLMGSLPHLAAHTPASTRDARTLGALRRAELALQDAAEALDVARRSVVSTDKCR